MASSSPMVKRWGTPPWTIDFRTAAATMPAEVDFAVVGGGFTGLAAAAWLKHLAPTKSVALLEAETMGAGSSGHTGGVTLAESAAGELPGLGDVLNGYQNVLRQLHVEGDLTLPGAWELGRANYLPDSAISWKDSGELRIVKEVPGGTIDPGKVVTGLARAAERLGALLFENSRVETVAFENTLQLNVSGKPLRAHQLLMATNAQSLELSELAGKAEPKFTLAVATEPLTNPQLEELGLATRKPFYTIDLPYLWGRLLPSNGVLFGSGLVHVDDWRELAALDIEQGEAARLIAHLEQRIRRLHPVLRSVEFAHRWGGPILIGEDWQPVFRRHPRSEQALVLGAYAGHGVAQSVYLGSWAAEVLLRRRALPEWAGG